MVKHPQRGNRRKNFVAIPFAAGLTLSTLADGVVLAGAALAAFGEDIFIVSMDLLWTLRGGTAGEGPIIVGVAHGDLTVTEIKEALEAELTDPDDIIAKERARRPVRRVGVFPGLATNESLEDGKKIRQKVKFSVGDTHTLNLFAQNNSGGALTGGQICNISGTIYGRWQR